MPRSKQPRHEQAPIHVIHLPPKPKPSYPTTDFAAPNPQRPQMSERQILAIFIPSLIVACLAVAFLASGGNNTPATSTRSGSKTMTSQDEQILGRLAIKEGYGAPLSDAEKNFMRQAKSGKLGQPQQTPSQNYNGR